MADHSSRAWTDRLPRWLLALVLVACVVRAVGKPAVINHDNSMYLQCAQLILEGGRPYVDFVDLNPPLVMFVSIPAALAAKLTGVPAVVCFNLFVAALLGLSAWQIDRLARRRLARDLAGWTALVWALASLTLMKLNDWGQREHLFMLLGGPALCAAGLGIDAELSSRERFALAFQLSLGALLKPHFFAIVAVVELFHLRTAGWRRLALSPYAVGLALPIVGYAAYWGVCPAEVRHAFFGRWVPLINAGYGAYARPLPAMVLRFLGTKQTIVLGLGLGAVLVLRDRLGELRGLVLALVAAAGVAELMAIAQRKGWSYHEVPFLILAITALGLAALALARARLAIRTLAAGLGLFTVAAAGLVATRGQPNPIMPAFATAVREHSQPHDPVLVLSSEVWPAYTALAVTDRRPGSRLLWLFPIPMLLSMGQTQESPAFHQVADELIEDLDQRRPRLVIAPINQQRPEYPFVQRYLRERLDRDYVRVGAIDPNFELLERRP